MGRFISADSIVPGAGSLTLSPHDTVAAAAWAKPSGGPANPQELNRYSYVLNNSLRNTDPTGHFCAGPVALVCAGAVAVYIFVAGGTVATQQPYSSPPLTPNQTDIGDLTERLVPEWVKVVPEIMQASKPLIPVMEALIPVILEKSSTILTAKKEDIKFFDNLQRTYKLTDKQRRELHDLITGQGWSKKEIEEEAKNMAEDAERSKDTKGKK